MTANSNCRGGRHALTANRHLLPVTNETSNGGTITMTVIEVEPTDQKDPFTCFLCGESSTGEQYVMFDGEGYATFSTVSDFFNTHGIVATKECDRGLDCAVHGDVEMMCDVAGELADKLDPHPNGAGDFEPVCSTCVHATRRDLRKRVTAHADQLEDAGWADFYGDGNEDLADHTLWDRGRYLRRYVGAEIAVKQPATT